MYFKLVWLMGMIYVIIKYKNLRINLLFKILKVEVVVSDWLIVEVDMYVIF